MSAPTTTDALTTIAQAIARVDEEHRRYSEERVAHETAIAEADATLREFALAAKRGNVSAQRKVDDAIARQRDSDAAHRLLTAALIELADEKRELLDQHDVARHVAARAERAEKAERLLVIAKRVDAQGKALAADMIEWAQLRTDIGRITQALGESDARVLPEAWPRLLSNIFWPVAPAAFDKVPPSQQQHSTFVALSTRYTTEDPHLDAAPINGSAS